MGSANKGITGLKPAILLSICLLAFLSLHLMIAQDSSTRVVHQQDSAPEKAVQEKAANEQDPSLSSGRQTQANPNDKKSLSKHRALDSSGEDSAESSSKNPAKSSHDSEKPAEGQPGISEDSIITNSRISPDSRVESSEIIDSIVKASTVIKSFIDPSNIINSTIIQSDIIDSNITNSIVNSSYIEGSEIEYMEVQNANITGNFMHQGTIIFPDNTGITGSLSIESIMNRSSSPCIIPHDGMVLKDGSSIRLCKGDYSVTDKGDEGVIRLEGSSITIECGNASMTGDSTGTAIQANGSLTVEDVVQATKDSQLTMEQIRDYLENNVTYLSNITLNNCRLENFSRAIALNSIKESNIQGLNLSGNEEGIQMLAKKSQISDSIISGSSKAGITIIGLNNTLEDSIIYNNRQGVMHAGFYTIIRNNQMLNNTQNGMNLLFTAESTITNNTAKYNTKAGIHLAEADNNTIENNELSRNSIGLKMSGFVSTGPSENNTIHSNTIINNTRAGIQATAGTLHRLAAAISRAFGSDQPKPAGHRIEKTSIKNNILNNPAADLTVKGEDFNNNTIQQNHFKGGGINISCRMNNEIQANNYSSNANFIRDNAPCVTDNDCDDGNSSTKDTCISKGLCTGFCTNGEINVNGTITDEFGNPAEGINISFYQETQYSPILNNTNTDSLTPKIIPDTTTNTNGYYETYLPENTVWHMRMQGSSKKDFNIFTNRTNKGRGHNTDIFENETYDSNNDFNVQGHIIYEGKHEHGNKYVCGESVEFMMFGMNWEDTNVTITYAVENHTGGGEPTDNRDVCDGVAGFTNESDVLWCSNISDTKDILHLPADGKKYEKYFAFDIPCRWNGGRYDIHVYDNSRWGKMHMIGTFFIVPDNESQPQLNISTLEIDASGISMYTNESVDLKFHAEDVSNETIPENEDKIIPELAVMNYVDCTLNVTFDKDVEVDTDGDGNTSNDVDFSTCGGWGRYVWNLSYPRSEFAGDDGIFNVTEDIFNLARTHKAKFTVTDEAGNKAEEYINITLWMTEDEGRELGAHIMIDAGFDFLETSKNYTTTSTFNPIHLFIDKWDMENGIEYMTPNDPNSSIRADLPDDWRQQLQNSIDGCEAEYILAANTSTAAEFNTTAYDHFRYVICECYDEDGPLCN